MPDLYIIVGTMDVFTSWSGQYSRAAVRACRSCDKGRRETAPRALHDVRGM